MYGTGPTGLTLHSTTELKLSIYFAVWEWQSVVLIYLYSYAEFFLDVLMFRAYLAKTIQHRSLLKWEAFTRRQRDKDISLPYFISSVFDGVGQLLPGDFAGLLISRPRLLAAGDSYCQKVLQRFSWNIQGAGATRTPLTFFSTSKARILLIYSSCIAWKILKNL